MKQLLQSLIMALMLLSIAGICLAVEGETPAGTASPEQLAEELAPLVSNRSDVDPPPEPILDTEPSHWSNVKALWG
jgi:hypothetical protein